jgi:hypothetical protein
MESVGGTGTVSSFWSIAVKFRAELKRRPLALWGAVLLAILLLGAVTPQGVLDLDDSEPGDRVAESPTGGAAVFGWFWTLDLSSETLPSGVPARFSRLSRFFAVPATAPKSPQYAPNPVARAFASKHSRILSRSCLDGEVSAGDPEALGPAWSFRRLC